MATRAYHLQDGGASLISAHPQQNATPIKLEYLNEGGANIVFQVLPLEYGMPKSLGGTLLRLRKDVSHVQAAAEQLRAFETNFAGLFLRENLVQNELVKLDTGLTGALNDSLAELSRGSHRQADVLPLHEAYGLLVTDMTAREGETLVQLKPKWLVQSPNAPPGARRCRTCALRALRASKQIQTATDRQESCPLDLISEDIQIRRRAAGQLTSDKVIMMYLASETQPLLQTLREQQVLLDPAGVLQALDKVSISNLCRAMTLRDCTLFLRASEAGIEARLGDLDLKQTEKLTVWANVERSLIVDGWYSNTENEQQWRREVICALSQ
jgi:inositol-pentakisphosphate 2-kinase